MSTWLSTTRSLAQLSAFEQRFSARLLRLNAYLNHNPSPLCLHSPSRRAIHSRSPRHPIRSSRSPFPSNTITSIMASTTIPNHQHAQRSFLHTETDPTKQYTYPAETGPHRATILGFPSRCSTFPALYDQTCDEIIDLAATIAHFEPVRLHVRPENMSAAQALLTTRMASSPTAEQARVTLLSCPTNHIWVRDTGPVYVRGADGSRAAVDFRFCEWGNKLDERIYNSAAEDDGWPVMDAAAQAENTGFAARALELDAATWPDEPVTRVVSRVRVEGGGIEMDGEGTLMAMESSVTVASRNAGLSRAEIEAELGRLLGVRRFIWIPGREGLDITDYHIDAEARFVRPGVVVVGRPHAKCAPVYWDVYREMRAVLDAATDARGRRLEVHDVEEPDPELVKGDVPGEEQEPAASYVNFYFTNGGLVIPAFGDAIADQRSLETMQKLLPEREIRQVKVNALPRTGGVLHCTTQQVI